MFVEYFHCQGLHKDVKDTHYPPPASPLPQLNPLFGGRGGFVVISNFKSTLKLLNSCAGG